MPEAFKKLLTSPATHRWQTEIQEGILLMCELYLDLVVTRLQYDPVPCHLLATLSLIMDVKNDWNNKNRDQLARRWEEVSPGPAHTRDRAKMSSGSSSDKEVPLPPLIPREAATEPLDSKPGYEKETENYEKSPRNYNDKMEGIAGYVPAQRLEWKRYKQYTRNDIMAAIEEVKKGRSDLVMLAEKQNPTFWS